MLVRMILGRDYLCLAYDYLTLHLQEPISTDGDSFHFH